MDERDIVDARGKMGKEPADVFAGLAVLAEGPLRPDDPALAATPAPAERADGDRLAVELVELRLELERVDLARPAVHEQPDDALRLGGAVDPANRPPASPRPRGSASES